MNSNHERTVLVGVSTTIALFILYKTVCKQHISYIITPVHKQKEFIKQAQSLIELEHGKDATNRTQSLEDSNDNLPYHIILIKQTQSALFKDSSPIISTVIGHVCLRKDVTSVSFSKLIKSFIVGHPKIAIERRLKQSKVKKEIIDKLIDTLSNLQKNKNKKEFSELTIESDEMKDILDDETKFLLSNERDVTIGGLLIHPKYRGNGFGKALVYASVVVANKFAYKSVVGSCAPHLLPFYAKFGANRNNKRTYFHNWLHAEISDTEGELSLQHLKNSKHKFDLSFLGF